MKRYDTLIDVLQAQSESSKCVRLIDGDKDETVISYQSLSQRAHSFLSALQERGMQPGDELIIVSKSNEKFLVAYWAAVLGGIVPVPVAVGISDEHRHKLFRIARQLKSPSVFTDDDLLQRLVDFAESTSQDDIKDLLESRGISDIDETGEQAPVVHQPQPDDIAFVQYSSGSTSDPKGVCLTHRNVTSTIFAQAEGLALGDGDATFSWMPLTHDMGLIGYHLTPVATGIDHSIMDTGVFVRRPLLWLSKVSEHRATTLCSPNFGYKHYLKVFERKPPADMDLSCVRLVLNGAEPISFDLCDEFLTALAPYGLKRTSMLPVYGLAEATLAVTFPELGIEYSAITVKRHSLRIGEPVEMTTKDDPDAVRFMKLGSAIRGCEYRIVDDNDQLLADKYVGNIQLAGENITKGIYRDADTTREIVTADGWLRTGDCGTTVDGQLVITGRAKDIIIVNGQNYYPHDIEEIIALHDELELGKVVVAGAKRPGHPVEELLVFILHRKDLEQFQTLASEVRELVGSHAALDVDQVIPISRVPKTTSGKIQRGLLVDAYLDGEYDSAIDELQSLGAAHQVADEEDQSGEDPLVLELVALTAEFTKDRKVGPDENLFEVGLTSLTLAEIMLALDEKYPAAVDINDLFDHPTIRELAGFLKNKMAAEA